MAIPANEVYKEYVVVVPTCQSEPNEGYRTYTMDVQNCVIVLELDQTEFDICYGYSFYHRLVASGGVAPYSYTLVGGLPPSLILDADELLGVVVQQGIVTATVRVEDATGAWKDFVLTFNIAPPLALDLSEIATVTPSTFYSQQLSIVGVPSGAGSISIAGGLLPDGLFFDEESRTIGGVTLVQSGTYPISAVLSYGGCSNTFNFSLFVYKLQLEPYSLCAAPNLPFYAQLVPLNGVSPFVWAIEGVPLPSYMTLNSVTGEITGSAATEEVVYTRVRLTDGLGNSTLADLTITVSFLCGSESGGIEISRPPGYPPVVPGKAPWIPSLQSKGAVVAANYFSDNLIKYLPSMYTE